MVVERNGDGLYVTCRECASRDDDWRDAKRRSGAMTTTAASDEDLLLAKVPTDGAGYDVVALMGLWNLKERATRDLVKRLGDRLRSESVQTSAGGAGKKLYWRAN